MKNVLFVLLISFILISCQKEKVELIEIYTDSTNAILDSSETVVKIKQNTTVTFGDFPAKIFHGELANPNFESNPDAKRFRTAIRYSCEKGINFAGHYTIAIWGCGSPCQSGAIVDRKTGEIYDYAGSSHGADYRKDSKLLIRNCELLDDSSNLKRDWIYTPATHEIWIDNKFEVIERF